MRYAILTLLFTILSCSEDTPKENALNNCKSIVANKFEKVRILDSYFFDTKIQHVQSNDAEYFVGLKFISNQDTIDYECQCNSTGKVLYNNKF